MKASFSLFVLVLFSGALFGQFKVPEESKKGFAKKYPDAESARWKSAKDGVYSVEFQHDGQKTTADFDSKGNWVQSEIKVGKEDLPAAVKQTIEKQYADFELDWAKKLSTPKMPVIYRVALDQEGYTERVNFSPDGKVLEKEEERD
ncbi:MAG: PepSY-like domain-containing protein [Lewinellaceae bacterium]|nr:PepSY-like domain-containing protein [Phaeodactylibacter sp.]MCB9039918.1 PepSY-like domain-containing protein [Lewinellaceae bacterium]